STLLGVLSGCDPKVETDDPPLKCAPGYEVQDNECVEVEVDTCFAPDDYSTTLTYEMVWNDEFDGTELDPSNWVYEVNGGGGGNNELQYYTANNTTVADGFLTITAKKEAYNGMDYTSSRVTTYNRAYFKYGIFEVRAKLPSGRGTWPAIWMMPQYSRYGGWPNSGEIDIMEHVGYNQNVIHGTIHTDWYNGKEGTQKGGSTSSYQDVSTEFHTYKIEWLPDKIKFFVDDVLYYTYIDSSYATCPTSKIWPFNSSFFIVLNVAVGGDWGGVQGVDENAFPTSMVLDYVRVYQATELEDFDDNSE
ncbi:glycoside hydrolase family 16 protein, partial [Candidatus Izimaplasma bacterium]|nr:glycoside hydrolase family 16 protein [Candidatus Izimaplasma bacterium]